MVNNVHGRILYYYVCGLSQTIILLQTKGKKLLYQWCSRIMFNRQRLSENRIHSDNNTRFKTGGEIGTREIYPNKSN